MIRDDRGMTLVELMIALAVSTIVIIGATVFLSTSQTSYQREKTRIDLQQEAQIATTQISNLLLEAKSTETKVHPTSGKLVLRIYGTPSGGSIEINEIYQDDNNTLRMNRMVTNGGIDYVYSYQNELLADYVDEFKYYETVPSSTTGKRLGEITLSLKSDYGSFESRNQVLLRNSSK